MRAAVVLAMLVTACASPAGASGSAAPSPSGTSAVACQPTSYRDASGVLTADGIFGVLGDTSTFSALAMNEPLVIVHRGATEQDVLALHFNSVGTSSPATSVSYGVGAKARANPWGAFVFDAGWKPIGFAGSCWRVIADGKDTGLVLEVRP